MVNPASRTTAEEARDIGALGRRRGWNRLLLVTSAFHMPRALASFRRQSGLTVIPVAFGAFGLVYLVSALVLGGLLLRGVWRVRHASDYVKPSWWVYGYSLLYLALLFVAMVIDHA
ncbi:MAG: ElyC/SanA/YdcF family protein, partial [bacterium]